MIFNQNNDCIRDYRLKLGLFILLNKLDQRLLDGHFGFIQIIILFLNTFNPSDRFMKDKLNLYILDTIFEISEKRNPLIYPFIKPIILILTSVYNFSDVLLTKKTERVFSILSYPKGDLYPIKSLPYHKNESYFIFSIYSKLIQAKNAESSFMKDEIDLSSLFDVYYSINSQIFSVSNEIDYTKEEGFEEKLANEYENTIFKDYHYYYYLLFYYSILCNNDNNLPYPMFLFVHERIRQHFGGFIFAKCFGVLTNDIDVDGKSYAYESNKIINNFDLECSFKYINYKRKSYDLKIEVIEFNQIPKQNADNDNNDDDVTLLKKSILSTYLNLFDLVNITYNLSVSLNWNIKLIRHTDKLRLFFEQTINPLKYLDTRSKIKIIQLFIRSSNMGLSRYVHISFNRFEANQFKESFEQPINESSDKKYKPLFIQLMNLVPVKSISMMKNSGNPFSVSLVDEEGVDAGGPGREVFSNIITEMINDHLGIFTMNPNMRNQLNDTNRDDLIPNKSMRNDIYQYKDDDQFSQRLIYAGALIAICINSNLPQQMDLAPFIWEFLLNSSVSIESIYEIDNEFKNFIQNAEDLLQKLSNSQTEDADEIESNHLYSFEISDSFGSLVELVPSGSKKNVTKDNLSEFIELAKDYRIHEFDDELNALKTGFNMIINNSRFLGILNPNDLKILACGEKECKISRMKELFKIIDNGPEDLSDEKINIFWKVMDSFSVHERLLFIRFSSGYMGLPAEGLSWHKKLEVFFQAKGEFENHFNLPHSHTCFLTVCIPSFESEEDLASMLRMAINSCECYGNA